MNSALRLTFAALLTVAVSAHAKIERTVEKTFAVNGAGLLRAETFGGAIRVTPGADQQVRVVVKQTIKADTDAQADELLKKLDLTLEQEGNDVRLMAKYERAPSGFRWGSWPPVQVAFEVTVPASFATKLSTSGGGITVGDLAGKAEAHTSGGAIKLGRMGGEVRAHTSGGSIALASASGPATLKTSGGNISAGPVAGAADFSTSGGNIKVDSVIGAVRAHTSGGSVSATIAGPLKEDCSLATSGGSVRVAVDRAAAFRLDAVTSGGGVDASGLTITLEKTSRDRSRLAGAVNGGGPLLKLRTSGGSISVRTE
ncbi:MAG: DUF4097 family beta strand repeat protein [Opitutaceae bacterium]|nr:DUF4097 family beta strand repeat protein [Opitutaceae bacterium]